MTYNNVKLLTDMLHSYQADAASESDTEIMKELYDNLEKQRPKLFRLASETDESDESGISESVAVLASWVVRPLLCMWVFHPFTESLVVLAMYVVHPLLSTWVVYPLSASDDLTMLVLLLAISHQELGTSVVPVLNP